LGGGATVGAVELAGGMAREGRQEAQAFLELNRALGLDYPTWVAFLDVARGRPFATRAELEALSYTARDAGQFAASYGMVAPARGWTEAERVEGLFRDVLAGLRLARYTGADEGQVASVLRLGARAGVVDPGEAETLAGILFQAVREGTREGVSAAETFQNVERYLQGLLAQGVTANERSLAFYAALLDRLSETQDRALMGEVGARAVGNILEGLTRTGQPGLEVLAFRALGGPELPTAREVGLEGAEAREYERLREVSPLLAARFLLEEARSLNPEVIRRMAAGFEAVMGGRPDLEYLFGTEFLGLSYEQVAALRGSYGSVFRFMQAVPPAELQTYLEARPQDVGTGGVAREIAEAGYRREFLEAETSRLKSLLAAQQDLDVGLRELGRSAAETANALGALARGIEQDPTFGPLLKGYRREQGASPIESVPIVGEVVKGLRKAFTPRPRTSSTPPPQAPLDVGALEEKAKRDAYVNRTLREMGATGITLGVGVRYSPQIRARYPKLPPTHQGLDLRIGRPGAGDPVRSPVAGEVARVGYDPEGYGRYVVLRSGEYEVLMAHLQEVRVRPGQKVGSGEIVGLEGATGAAKGAHLHLELRQGGKAITDQEAFWDALARLTAPAPREGGGPASIQIGGNLTVHVQGVPPEMGARVAKRVEEVVGEELGRWGKEAPSPYNEGQRRGGFR
ncbi:M23 family metallopeptidase, partial [Thermus scotoductus]|uniref:M23 family metallopeptidase n=5 Tax=Thermus scotoductus TaxID=37636 RepID=UPI001000EE5E